MPNPSPRLASIQLHVHLLQYFVSYLGAPWHEHSFPGPSFTCST